MNSTQNSPASVDAYIANFPADVQTVLHNLRALIRQEAPEAEELISYNLPTYKLNGPLVYFGAFQNHIGFYATPTGHEAFQEELSKYKSGKGSVRFPLNEPLPTDLIRRIVKFRIQENLEKRKPKKKPTPKLAT